MKCERCENEADILYWDESLSIDSDGICETCFEQDGGEKFIKAAKEYIIYRENNICNS